MHWALMPGTMPGKLKLHKYFSDEWVNWGEEGMEISDTIAFAFDPVSFLKGSIEQQCMGGR